MDKAIKIKKWDWILIIGACLAPMTGLRIWKIGPAELLCFIWGLRYFPKKKYKLNMISKFFIVFLGSMAIGTLICIIKAPEELAITDWATWLFLTFIALALYEGIRLNPLKYNEKILYVISVVSIIWYLGLFFYSRYISTTFLGAPLWYHGVRYTGGGTNPHQLAVLMCSGIFCLARDFALKKHRIICVAGIVAATFIEIQTASSTGLLSIVLGALLFAIVLTFYKVKSSKSKVIIIILELIAGLFIVVLGYQIIYRYAYDWVASDANGLGRLELFSGIKDVLIKSPVFGLGPGVHAKVSTGFKEFHNTYLEIIAATGIVGFVGFITLTVRALKKLNSDATLMPILVAMYAYGLAGFAMRRLAYWVVFVFILVISEQIFEKTKGMDKGDNVC